MPTATYIALANITLSASEADIVFTSIPNTYRDLVVVVNGKVSTSSEVSLAGRLNGDSASNYSNVRMYGSSGGATSYSDTAAEFYIGITKSNTEEFTSIIHVMDYSATDKHKTILARGSQSDDAVTAHAGRWANTNAVTSVTITRPTGQTYTFESGTTMSLYGIVS